MVAVHHEVVLPDLVEIDRRQVLALWNAWSMRFHLCPTLALAGRKDRSKSLHRPTLPTISSTSTTLVPRWRRLLAACALLRSSKESNLFEVCSLRIRAATVRKRARRLARVKSASTCSFRFMYGIIFSSLLKIGLWARKRATSCAKELTVESLADRTPGLLLRL